MKLDYPKPLLFLFLLVWLVSCAPYDLIISNGTIYDGSGEQAYVGDIGVKKDKIKDVGTIEKKKAKHVLDASGLVVAPGFINGLSWAGWSLLKDGRSMSDIKQGVTLEVLGEGASMGPYNPAHSEKSKIYTFGEYMRRLEKQGTSTNFASFVGATTVRWYLFEGRDQQPTPDELKQMQELVRQAMKEGALGVGSSLIYPPAFFATTDELIALSQAAGDYGGMYISHMRSEGDKLLQATDELIRIASEANVPAEIFHMKAAGERNWHKLDQLFSKIDSARQSGLQITANMYNYTGASTGLAACMPPWIREGKHEDWMSRLSNDSVRAVAISEMESDVTDWENFLSAAGKPENILLLEFQREELKKYTGWNLAEISQDRGTSPAETALDLCLLNDGNISSAFFLMSEENVRKQMTLPYMSFCSDARSIAAEGENLESMTHPRTYGNFSRLLGKYVREEKVIPMEEAIYKLTLLPAQKFSIQSRGKLEEGYFADIVLFDPAKIIDKATFKAPHQYAEGMVHVFVNGKQVIDQGEHTGKMPGRFVPGPGFQN
ncbi:MAG: D-aminoacylase [Cyclobacteriaceae bacterium]|nr:D-aminoacylase [Cyclobacteriaceae bacterium HetDA_MAG_MS6]